MSAVTVGKKFKRVVRARMARDGVGYSEALRRETEDAQIAAAERVAGCGQFLPRHVGDPTCGRCGQPEHEHGGAR